MLMRRRLSKEEVLARSFGQCGKGAEGRQKKERIMVVFYNERAEEKEEKKA